MNLYHSQADIYFLFSLQQKTSFQARHEARHEAGKNHDNIYNSQVKSTQYYPQTG